MISNDHTECTDSECSNDDNSTDSSHSNKSNDDVCRYRYTKCGKMVLNVHPQQSMYLDNNYLCLYEILYKGILDNNLEIQLKCLLASSSSAVYNSFYNLLLTIFKLNPLPSDGLRLVVTEPDGTVVVDTAMTTLNTFANWKTKSINENHNSRIAIIDAQTLEGGVGYETKHSSTLDLYQYMLQLEVD